MAARDGGRLEVSAMGLVMLGAATAVATGIVFLLGVYVGKGVTEERLANEQRVVRLPVQQIAEPPGSGEVEVTFWDRLGKEDTAPEPLPTSAPTPTEMAVRVVPPVVAAATPTPMETPVPKAAAPRATPVSKAAAPTPTAVPEPQVSAVLRGTYQVQVQALSDRSAAERLSRELERRGYQSRISPAKIGGQTLYRVRVGTFATEDEAREAVAKLRTQGYPGAFLAAGGGD